MKRTLAILLVISLLCGMLAVDVAASEEPIATGTCGENLTWTFDGWTLTISGSGPMYDYSEENPAPWKDYSPRKCIMADGITRIGDYAFDRKAGTLGMECTIPATVTEIGEKAFVNCGVQLVFKGSAPMIAGDAFEGMRGPCGYIYGWEESDLQDYGGSPHWIKGKLGEMLETKRIYMLNEEVKTEDFLFSVVFNGYTTTFYRPQTIQTEAYDASVCGEKQVKVVADGVEFTHIFIVSDGVSHLDLVKIEYPTVFEYNSSAHWEGPKVTAGSLTLIENQDYSWYVWNPEVENNNPEVGPNARMELIGMGEWEGLLRTVPFSILKNDLSDATVSVGNAYFCGMPVEPEIKVYLDGHWLVEGEDFTVTCENNVNVGTASYCVIGIGNYCGSKEGTFQITNYCDTVPLYGAYNGLATDEIVVEEVYYSEMIIPPGFFRGEIAGTSGGSVPKHYAYYELYRMEGEEPVLITTLETEYGSPSHTQFTYDFSSVYEDAAEEGGEIYMLSYAWIEGDASLYAGACVLLVPAKVPDATAMEMEKLEGTGDYNKIYLSVFGTDGNLGAVEWTSSDSGIATVNGGVVTLNNPGDVTITGKFKDLTAIQEITVKARDLSQGKILNYDAETGKTDVYYEGQLLTVDTDYTQTVTAQKDLTEVSAKGIGLFTGELMQQFDAAGERVGHCHGFKTDCDTDCGGCEYTREVTAEHTAGDEMGKDSAGHWHVCVSCGGKADYAEHTIDPEDPNTCTVCGSVYTPGDTNGDFQINNKDVEHLLWYTLFPENYPLKTAADYDGDGTVNNKDVEYLLWHTLFPENYPL